MVIILSRPQEGFQADIEGHVVFKAIEQGDLINQDGSQRNPLGIDRAFRRDLPLPLEDPLEMLMEVFYR
ncbi:MAG: hypothetical protein IT210_24885 [Armatimonadetes bacterium]|nr:hypothetical protein [Armatimonadota bacterium]